MKTADPGTVVQPSDALAMKASRGIESVSSRDCSTGRPRFHVDINKKTPKPNASGNQPPSLNLRTLALKNARSMSRKAPKSAMLASALHFHIERATTYASIVVVAIVPVTAMPYAAPRLVDDPKPMTRTTTPKNSAQ